MQSPHPALAPLEFLIGTWRGRGRGGYPTIEPFEYIEQATYTPGPGKPFIAYYQKTRRSGGNGEPLHSEAGYIRPVGSGGAELVISQPTGVVEVHTGQVADGRIDFRTSLVGAAPTAVDVSRVYRSIQVTAETMKYRLGMEAVGQPLQVHLEAELTRLAGS
ncbi:MAG: FABP family protein [bacterium]|nr:FABP family protein [bacterium]